MDLITRTTAVLDAPPEPLQLAAHFCYSDTDPLTVRMILILHVHFPSGAVAEDKTPWDFSRELLDSAFSKPGETVGEGDVKITYVVTDDPGFAEHQLRVDLTGVVHDHVESWPVWIDARPVITFMAESLKMVPSGAEHPDVDGAIARLLDGTYEA